MGDSFGVVGTKLASKGGLDRFVVRNGVNGEPRMGIYLLGDAGGDLIDAFLLLLLLIVSLAQSCGVNKLRFVGLVGIVVYCC